MPDVQTDDADWPTAKLLARHEALSQAGDTRKPAVLLTTGAMNPVHLGHVDMFSRARRCLEQEHGFSVLAGYLSPSHEGYVRPKCERFEQKYLESDVRLECVRRAVQDSDWLECGAWEAAPARADWPDFPDVVKALQTHLSGPDGCERDLTLGGQKCTVFYVCGLDHFEKCNLRLGLLSNPSLPAASRIEQAAGVVAIPRDDAPPVRTDLKRLVVGVTESNPALTHLSSTRVRQLLESSPSEQSVQERRAALAEMVGEAVADLLLGPGRPLGTAAIGGGGAAEQLGMVPGGAAPMPHHVTAEQLPQTMICVGDLHGNIDKTVQLWSALEAELGVAGLDAAHVVFLGDYCDRGPRTREVLDFLIDLERRRAPGTTTFLAGNHDFAFGCFLGCLDVVPAGFDLDSTKDSRYTSGYWTAAVHGGMHYQGRRWGGDERTDIYDARATFSSYGVTYGTSAESREALIQAVPEAHKLFLNRLLWVYDAPVGFAPGRVVCVHAGLFTKGSLEEQLAALHNKRLDAPALQIGGYGRFEALSGRREVEEMHPELKGKSLLISGHHGFTSQQGDRLIVDTSGGHPGDEYPIEAVVLPSRRLVSSASCDPLRRPDRFQMFE